MLLLLYTRRHKAMHGLLHYRLFCMNALADVGELTEFQGRKHRAEPPDVIAIK